jgi:hypothetical protein
MNGSLTNANHILSFFPMMKKSRSVTLEFLSPETVATMRCDAMIIGGKLCAVACPPLVE